MRAPDVCLHGVSLDDECGACNDASDRLTDGGARPVLFVDVHDGKATLATRVRFIARAGQEPESHGRRRST